MKKFTAMIVAFIIVLGTVFTISIYATPGDENDPVIVLSYIQETLLPKIQKMIDSSIAKYDKEKGNSNNGGSGTSVETHMAPVESSYATVNLQKGQTVICATGAEMIIRMGSAKIIATEKGGIADVTAGVDLPHGSQAPSNSLLIVPAGDGRGIRADNTVIVLIKGTYSLYK